MLKIEGFIMFTIGPYLIYYASSSVGFMMAASHRTINRPHQNCGYFSAIKNSTLFHDTVVMPNLRPCLVEIPLAKKLLTIRDVYIISTNKLIGFFMTQGPVMRRKQTCCLVQS